MTSSSSWENVTTILSNEFPSSPLSPMNDGGTTDTTAASDELSSSSLLSPIVAAILSNIFLFFLIFGLSATVQVHKLRQQLQNITAICTGIVMQFMIMPFLGFVAVVCMQYITSTSTTDTSTDDGFTYAMGITLLVVTSSPGGSYSNWWCSVFNADLALSVAMTSISSLLSIAFLPANLLLYTWLTYNVFLPSEEENVVSNDVATTSSSAAADGSSIVEILDFKSLFLSLSVVLSGIGIGLYSSYMWGDKYPKFRQRANHLGSISGLGLILFSIAASSSSSSSTGGNTSDGSNDTPSPTNIFLTLPWTFYVGVAFPCICGVVLANVLSRCIGKLTQPECVTISIECCYQNTAIGASVALTMFASDTAQLTQAISVPLFYGVVEALLIGCYCVYAWKMGWTKAPKDEKLCVIMTTTYEGGNDGQEDSDDGDSDWFEDSFKVGGTANIYSKGDEENGIIKKNVISENNRDPIDRNRCYSADVTVATTSSMLSTTPTSPASPRTATICETEIILISSSQEKVES